MWSPCKAKPMVKKQNTIEGCFCHSVWDQSNNIQYCLWIGRAAVLQFISFGEIYACFHMKACQIYVLCDFGIYKLAHIISGTLEFSQLSTVSFSYFQKICVLNCLERLQLPTNSTSWPWKVLNSPNWPWTAPEQPQWPWKVPNGRKRSGMAPNWNGLNQNGPWTAPNGPNSP